MSLAGTWARYEVEPVAVTERGLVSLGTYYVRHPSAREAISILEYGEAASDGDDDAWYLIRATLGAWLPLRLASILLSSKMSRGNAVRIATVLLSVGLTTKDQKDHERRKRARVVPWSVLVASYRHTYPSGSLDEPWPFWLEQAMQVDRIRSRNTLDGFMASALGQTGNKAVLDDLRRRAGYDHDDVSEEEVGRRQMATLEHLKSVHHQMQKNRLGKA